MIWRIDPKPEMRWMVQVRELVRYRKRSQNSRYTAQNLKGTLNSRLTGMTRNPVLKMANVSSFGLQDYACRYCPT